MAQALHSFVLLMAKKAIDFSLQGQSWDMVTDTNAYYYKTSSTRIPTWCDVEARGSETIASGSCIAPSTDAGNRREVSPTIAPTSFLKVIISGMVVSGYKLSL